jgi:hypothetical protein
MSEIEKSEKVLSAEDFSDKIDDILKKEDPSIRIVALLFAASQEINKYAEVLEIIIDGIKNKTIPTGKVTSNDEKLLKNLQKFDSLARGICERLLFNDEPEEEP